jgi:cell division protein FtsL
MIIIVVGIMILGGGFFLFFWLKSKKGATHPFYIYSTDGIHREKVEATVVTDPNNQHKKMFYFPSRKVHLEIRPPNAWIGQIGIREITINTLNEYSYLDNRGLIPKDMTEKEKDILKAKYGMTYLEKTKFCDKQYLKLSLIPEEKSIALYRYKENANRFKNPIDKMQGMLFGLTLVMVLLVMIGVIYSTIAFVNVAGDMTELQIEINKGKEQDVGVMNTMAEISKQQTQIIGSWKSGEDIVRQIT